MDTEWRTNPEQTKALRQELERHRRELQGDRAAALDAALSSPDPVSALRDLSVRDAELQTLGLALARLKTMEEDLRNQARVRERNERRKANPGSILTT
jgi:hypothetical protein